MSVDRRTFVGTGLALGAAAWAPPVVAAKGNRSFPKGFIWGAATSGHQVEGNNLNSDTWVQEHVKPTIYAEPSGDAANSFDLWPRDLDLVKKLGLDSYRFSIEWSRIEPEPGMFSVAMLDHYKAMIAGCRARGLIPFVTFNHFTTPKWFAAKGGWSQPDAVAIFARYCDRAARHLAAEIGYAATLNEPNLVHVVRSGLGQRFASFKPVLAAMAVAAARSVGSDKFVAGSTLGVEDLDAHTARLIDVHRAARAAIKAVRSDLPVGVTLAMPDDQASGPGSLRDQVRAKNYLPWLDAARSDDFLGVQNYERSVWDAKGVVEGEHPGVDKNAAGAPVFADSLANAVRYAHSVAKVPIIVTEHGVNSADDAVRARLIPAALAALKQAIDDGVPVKGYYHWSLLDNYEWIFGYKYRYGLVAVDRTTFVRTPKPSAAVYAAIARRNALPR